MADLFPLVLAAVLMLLVGFGGAYLGCFVGVAMIRRDLGLDAAVEVEAVPGGESA